MKILLIGHSVVDKIESGVGVIIKPGGIYYSAAGLVYFKEQDDKIYLATGLEGKQSSLFLDIYSQIDLKYSTAIRKLPTVHLKIRDDKERDECYSGMPDSLQIVKINNANIFDGILINMISGNDISLSDLKKLRSNYCGLIYFDVHTLSRGVDINNQRNFRIVPERIEWLSNVDILQVNECELFTIAAEPTIELCAAQVLSYGPKFLIVTKGRNGVEAFYKKENKIENYKLSAITVAAKNNVGCGDIFGALFFYSYIQTGNFLESLTIANIGAGLFSSYSDVGEMKGLKNAIAGRFS